MTSGPAWPGPITTLACPRTALLSPVCPSQLGWKGFRRAPPRPPNSLSPSRGCMDEDSSSLSKWSSTQSTEAQCSPARLSPAQPGSVRPALARGCGHSPAQGQLPAAFPLWVVASPLPVRSVWSPTLSLGPCPSPGPPCSWLLVCCRLASGSLSALLHLIQREDS